MSILTKWNKYNQYDGAPLHTWWYQPKKQNKWEDDLKDGPQLVDVSADGESETEQGHRVLVTMTPPPSCDVYKAEVD